MAKSKIVAAVGSSAVSGNRPGLSKAIEVAQAAAILKANEQGIPVTNDKEIAKRMADARAKAKDDWLAAAAKEQSAPAPADEPAKETE